MDPWERLAGISTPLSLQQRSERARAAQRLSDARRLAKLAAGLDETETILALDNDDDRVRYKVLHEDDESDLLGAPELKWMFRRHLDIILGCLDPEAPPPTPQEQEWAEQACLEFSVMHRARYDLLLDYRYNGVKQKVLAKRYHCTQPAISQRVKRSMRWLDLRWQELRREHASPE